MGDCVPFRREIYRVEPCVSPLSRQLLRFVSERSLLGGLVLVDTTLRYQELEELEELEGLEGRVKLTTHVTEQSQRRELRWRVELQKKR